MKQKSLLFTPPGRPEMPYLLYLPAGYRPTGKPRPLMIFLHGAGERGSDPALVTRHGPPKLVEAGAKFPFILASPQCRAGSNWNTDDLKAFFDFLLAEYNVDAKSVYLTGISMGGFATWNFASEHPEFFAAIAPVCGGGDYIRSHLLPPDRQEALKTLPVRTFHGDQDDVVPVSETVRMVEIFRRAGNRSVEFTVYPGVDHDSWTSAYATPGLFEWFAAQRRA